MKRCDWCGRENEAPAEVCWECGNALAAEPPAETEPAELANPPAVGPPLAPQASGEAPLPFEAMTTGALLDQIFRLYGGNFALLLGIVAVTNVPVYGLQLLLGWSWGISPSPEQRAAATMISSLITLAWALVAYPLAQGAATWAISECYLGRSISVGRAYQQAWKRWRTILNAQISVGLRVGFGLLLLIIPGVLWMLTYWVTIPVVMMEGKKAAESMERSRDLTSGHRRKVFNVLGLVLLLGWLAGAAIGATVGAVFGLGTPTGRWVEQVAIDLANLLCLPLGVVGAVLLYYDLRIRKEGFDLELLGQALAGQTGQAVAAPPA